MGEAEARRGGMVGLWIAAGVLLIATVALYLYPAGGGSGAPQPAERAELDSTISKASTYYEFGHYERAAETYATAIERGMEDAVEWYRYARSLELSRGLDLRAYMRAYRLLLLQAPEHEHTQDVASVLTEHAVPFVYSEAQAAEYETGTLVRLVGTVSRVVWGRVESHSDTLYVATRPDDWLGHVGEEVMVEAPRHRRYEAGDPVDLFGWYEGWTRSDDGTGITREYPHVTAAGAHVLASD